MGKEAKTQGVLGLFAFQETTTVQTEPKRPNYVPSDERMTAFLGVKLRQEDLARIDALAEHAGVSRSTMARRLLAAGLGEK